MPEHEAAFDPDPYGASPLARRVEAGDFGRTPSPMEATKNISKGFQAILRLFLSVGLIILKALSLI